MQHTFRLSIMREAEVYDDCMFALQNHVPLSLFHIVLAKRRRIIAEVVFLANDFACTGIYLHCVAVAVLERFSPVHKSQCCLLIPLCN